MSAKKIVTMVLLSVPVLFIHLVVRVVRAVRAAAWELCPGLCAYLKYFIGVANDAVKSAQTHAASERFFPWFLRADAETKNEEENDDFGAKSWTELYASCGIAEDTVSAAGEENNPELVWSTRAGKYKYRTSTAWRNAYQHIRDVILKLNDELHNRIRARAGKEAIDECQKEIDRLYKLMMAETNRGYMTSYDQLQDAPSVN